MATDIRELNSRVQELRAEVTVRRRRRQAGAESVVETLKNIPSDKLDRLSAYVPELNQIRLYTVDDIVNSEHDELKTIQRVHADLIKYLETTLEEYEGHLKG